MRKVKVILSVCVLSLLLMSCSSSVEKSGKNAELTGKMVLKKHEFSSETNDVIDLFGDKKIELFDIEVDDDVTACILKLSTYQDGKWEDGIVDKFSIRNQRKVTVGYIKEACNKYTIVSMNGDSKKKTTCGEIVAFSDIEHTSNSTVVLDEGRKIEKNKEAFVWGKFGAEKGEALDQPCDIENYKDTTCDKAVVLSVMFTDKDKDEVFNHDKTEGKTESKIEEKMESKTEDKTEDKIESKTE